MSTWYIIPSDSDLQHHGILGMKWGVRRYQNKDGSLTAAGRKRYSDVAWSLSKNTYKSTKDLDKAANEIRSNFGKTDIGDGVTKIKDQYGTSYEKDLKTDIGNVSLLNITDNISEEDVKKSFNSVSKNASKIVKEAANAIIKDDRTIEILSGLEMDSNGKYIKKELSSDTIKRLKKGLNDGEILINTYGGKGNIAVCFYPSSIKEFGGHELSIEMDIDNNGNIIRIDKNMQMNG